MKFKVTLPTVWTDEAAESEKRKSEKKEDQRRERKKKIREEKEPVEKKTRCAKKVETTQNIVSKSIFVC